MRTDTIAPKHIVIGRETAGGTMYEVRRTSDMLAAAYILGYVTDDGVPGHHTFIRQWHNAASAQGYLDMIEADAEQTHLKDDLPLLWVKDTDAINGRTA
jgi:hypothetical protein